MVTTRAFIGSVSRTVIAHPSLIFPAFKLYNSTRAHEKRGLSKLLPSRKYLSFRIYTQYGHEDVEPAQLRKEIAQYLNWVKNSA